MPAAPQSVNLAAAFAAFQEHWQPHLAAVVNDTHVKLVKLQGAFVWHHHDHEDELFLVIRGTMTMRLRTGDVRVGPGEFIVIPRGTEHCPVADEEVHLLLIEPATTVNTGSAGGERTRAVRDLPA